MANLEKLAANYSSEGYSALLAEARVCQDIVLKAISESSLLYYVCKSKQGGA